MKFLQIVAIKIDHSFDFYPYLSWLQQDAISKIMRFKFNQHRVIAFVSALLKYYYLKYIIDKTHLHSCEYLRNRYNSKKLNSLLPNDFVYNSHEKPFLHQVACGCGVYFNISHSGEYVVLSCTNYGIIGVDIEKIDYNTNCRDLSRSVFSLDEQDLLFNSTIKRDSNLTFDKMIVDNYVNNFFFIWTKKEATLKAIGCGITNNLKRFSFNLDEYQVLEYNTPWSKLLFKEHFGTYIQNSEKVCFLPKFDPLKKEISVNLLVYAKNIFDNYQFALSILSF